MMKATSNQNGISTYVIPNLSQPNSQSEKAENFD